jgi:hypothetical protein
VSGLLDLRVCRGGNWRSVCTVDAGRAEQVKSAVLALAAAVRVPVLWRLCDISGRPLATLDPARTPFNWHPHP